MVKFIKWMKSHYVAKDNYILYFKSINEIFLWKEQIEIAALREISADGDKSSSKEEEIIHDEDNDPDYIGDHATINLGKLEQLHSFHRY